MKSPSRRDRIRLEAKKGSQQESDEKRCLRRILKVAGEESRAMDRRNRREAARYDNPLRHPKQRKAAGIAALCRMFGQAEEHA